MSRKRLKPRGATDARKRAVSDPRQAVATAREVLRLTREAFAHDPTRPEVLAATDDLVRALASHGEHREVVEIARPAVRGAVARGEPGRVLDLATLLGKSLGALGRFDEALFWHLQSIITIATHGTDLEAAERLLRQVEPAVEASPDDVRCQAHQARWILSGRRLGGSAPETVALALVVGRSMRDLGYHDAALAIFEAALAGVEAREGPDSLELVEALHLLGQARVAAGDPAGAKREFERALDIQTRHLPAGDRRLAQSLANLASMCAELADFDRAAALGERALAILDASPDAGDADMAHVLNNVAAVYAHRCQPGRAAPLLERSIAAMERFAEHDRGITATPLSNLGSVYQRMGDLGAARGALRRALAAAEASTVDRTDVVLGVLSNLGQLHLTAGDLDDARAAFERAAALADDRLPPKHPGRVSLLINLAACHREQGDDVEAERLYTLALSVAEEAYGPRHPSVATALSNLAALHGARGERDKAMEYAERALAVVEGVSGADHVASVGPLNNMATVYFDAGEFAKGRRLLERALAIHDRSGDARSPAAATVMANLAFAHASEGDDAGAERLHERALAVRVGVLGEAHLDTAASLVELARFAVKRRALDVARGYWQRAHDVVDAIGDDVHRARVRDVLAEIERARGRLN